MVPYFLDVWILAVLGFVTVVSMVAMIVGTYQFGDGNPNVLEDKYRKMFEDSCSEAPKVASGSAFLGP